MKNLKIITILFILLIAAICIGCGKASPVVEMGTNHICPCGKELGESGHELYNHIYCCGTDSCCELAYMLSPYCSVCYKPNIECKDSLMIEWYGNTYACSEKCFRLWETGWSMPCEMRQKCYDGEISFVANNDKYEDD